MITSLSSICISMFIKSEEISLDRENLIGDLIFSDSYFGGLLEENKIEVFEPTPNYDGDSAADYVVGFYIELKSFLDYLNENPLIEKQIILNAIEVVRNKEAEGKFQLERIKVNKECNMEEEFMVFNKEDYFSKVKKPVRF